jgi:hypothetical protein
VSGNGRPRRAAHPRRQAEAHVPKRPYRDSALVMGALAIALVVVAWLTGGSVSRAVVVGVGFFVLSTAYTWWRFRQRLERQADDRGR